MSKHQEILEYLENLAVGKRVSVRSIANHLKVSEGTAYRAIKEGERRGLVETRPRSGTVRVEQKPDVRIERLTYAEIARISDSEVLAGEAGLGHEFSKFSIGAMTRQNIGRYLVKGGLLIVGDRENIQLLALENHNAILVTGGFSVSERVISLADNQGIPVMVTHYDTFTVATMINHALSNVRIKTDLKTVGQVYQSAANYGYLTADETIKAYHALIKQTTHVRFPVVDADNQVIGVISMRDVLGKDSCLNLTEVMTENPIVAKPNTSLASISQKMIFEDLNMLPVVSAEQTLLGVITRRQVMENLPDNLRQNNLYTYSDQMIANLSMVQGNYQFIVEPAMIDYSGNLAQGVLAELLKEIAVRVLTQKKRKNIIIEQMMLYFLQAVQIDDKLTIHPQIISENRRSLLLDIAVYLNSQMVAKAIITTKIN
ncbi:CBS domain-containing protein [Streptococcus chenjunshii]|uniref:CBS domain-containing protein n=1 Tax=Streptococcus chenjunshii TaxID=2173853 RepID=A0A372KJX6_9STRE|nr:CBS-HotDog domain-containing transcription factor SpxR [Streptococcus chenjunshii]AXQ78346.1 CBS domain-containing protein [Streptococcus chenjunshii]RFU50350.1 CBS domain-containing protein [Streptococcus chenjunshii]RFU52569.1 CBS domain-containing protein [Streptococcus chenjunshii]